MRPLELRTDRVPTRDELRNRAAEFARSVYRDLGQPFPDDPDQAIERIFGRTARGNAIPPEDVLDSEPMPEPWFDHPAAHRVRRPDDRSDGWLDFLCGRFMAGSPVGSWPTLDRLTREAEQDPAVPCNDGPIFELFQQIRPADFLDLAAELRVSVYRMVRLLRRTRSRNGHLVNWLNENWTREPGS